MPKKLLKRFSPSKEFIQEHPSLAFLGVLIEDPNLFHLNRYSVPMAFLVGGFLAFFPIPAQMVVAAIVALWVRCNLPIAIALVWITNPLTIAPIFFATYKLGTWLLDTPALEVDANITWEWINSEIDKIWKPLLVGSLCAGSIFSLSGYFSVKILWRWHVARQWNKRKQRRKAKANQAKRT